MSNAHKINEVNNMKHNNTETRIALLEQSTQNINENLKEIRQSLVLLNTKIDTKIDALDKKIDSKFDFVDKRFELLDKKIDEKFDKLNSRIWTNFYWGAGGFASVLGVLAHAMHWI